MDRSRIGIDRDLRPDWLDTAGSVAAQGLEGEPARRAVFEALEGAIPGADAYSARGKTTTILRRIWLRVPVDARSLQAEAAGLLALVPHEDRVALHWSMIIAAYPFFNDCAAVAGRLTSLNGSFVRVEHTRRMRELWGQRSTVDRASSRALVTMRAMGVLMDAEGRVCEVPRHHADARLSAMLLEAVLLSEDRHEAPAEQLSSHPALFPFELESTAVATAGSSRLRMERRGGDTDVVVRA